MRELPKYKEIFRKSKWRDDTFTEILLQSDHETRRRELWVLMLLVKDSKPNIIIPEFFSPFSFRLHWVKFVKKFFTEDIRLLVIACFGYWPPKPLFPDCLFSAPFQSVSFETLNLLDVGVFISSGLFKRHPKHYWVLKLSVFNTACFGSCLVHGLKICARSAFSRIAEELSCTTYFWKRWRLMGLLSISTWLVGRW